MAAMSLIALLHLVLFVLLLHLKMSGQSELQWMAVVSPLGALTVSQALIALIVGFAVVLDVGVIIIRRRKDS